MNKTKLQPPAELIKQWENEAETIYPTIPVEQGDYGVEQKYVKNKAKILKYRKVHLTACRLMWERGASGEGAVVEKLRQLFSDYVKSEGCGCCENTVPHSIAAAGIGELLGFKKYKDNSGYNFYELP